MSVCARCGATFSCAMVDPAPGADPAAPCWCTYLPASLPVPSAPGSSCWCADCLRRHIAASSAEVAKAQGSDADPPSKT